MKFNTQKFSPLFSILIQVVKLFLSENDRLSVIWVRLWKKTLDFSQNNLESQPMWKRRLWQSLVVLGMSFAGVGLFYVLKSPDELLGWQILQFGSYSLFLLPATGWYYHKFSFYIRYKNGNIEVKPLHKQKEKFAVDEIESLSFSNNNLYVTLKNGQEKQFDFSRNTFKYKEIQDIKQQIQQFYKSLLS